MNRTLFPIVRIVAARFALLVVFTVAVIFVVARITVVAQEFIAPITPPPDNNLVGVFGNLTGFLQLTPQPPTTLQSMLGPLTVGANDTYGAQLGGAFTGAALLASAGSQTIPALSSFGLASASLYGYATGALTNYGAAGYSDGAGGIGLLGRAEFVDLCDTETWYHCDWSHRMKITVDHTKVAADDTQFPILIDTSTASQAVRDSLKYVLYGGNVGRVEGDDILFTGPAGLVKIRHDIESYNGETGELVVWVELPTISSLNDTEVYLYYGNELADAQNNAQQVWDSTNVDYIAVWHLGDGVGMQTDATGNGHDGEALDDSRSTTGKVGTAMSFDGVDDAVVVPYHSSLNQVNFSISFFMRRTSPNDGVKRVILHAMDDTISTTQGLEFSITDDVLTFTTRKALGSLQANGITAGNWYHIVATRLSLNSTVKLYVNGSEVDSDSANYTPNATDPLYIGMNPYNVISDAPFEGDIDELRVVTAVMSANRVATEYNNLNSPGTFYSFGVEEAYVPSGAVPFAGKFYGNVEVVQDPDTAVAGSLTVQGEVVSGRITGTAATNPVVVPAFLINAGAEISGGFGQGLYAIASGSGAAALYAKSNERYGVSSVVANGDPDVNDMVIGVKGDADSAVGYGVFGSALFGNGIVGTVSGASNLSSVRGVSTGSFPGSSGVAGDSDGWAGIFDGEVRILDGNSMTIGSTLLDEAQLLELLEWCVSKGSCLDDYCRDGGPVPCDD